MKEHDHGHQLIYLDKDVTIHIAQGKLNVTNTLKCNISRERCLIRIEHLTFCFIIYSICVLRLYLKPTVPYYQSADVWWLFFLSDHKFRPLIIYVYYTECVDGILMASMEAAVVLIKDAQSQGEMSVNPTMLTQHAVNCEVLFWSITIFTKLKVDSPPKNEKSVLFQTCIFKVQT